MAVKTPIALYNGILKQVQETDQVDLRVGYVAVNDQDRINTSLSNDLLVGFTTLTAVREYQISSEDIAQTGRLFTIKDESGNAGTYGILVSTEGSETIDGDETVTMNVDYSALTLYSNGSNLFIY